MAGVDTTLTQRAQSATPDALEDAGAATVRHDARRAVSCRARVSPARETSRTVST
jgi:hypothetical protein